MIYSIEEREITHFHFCIGAFGAAMGFNQARPEFGNLRGKFRCIGGVDVNPALMPFAPRLAGVQATVLDLFDREQYTAFHGHQPPSDWREATVADIHRAAGYQRPNIVFISAPCKGFSGLLSQQKSMSEKYQALNRLTLRCVWLMCEAWGEDPPEFFAFENVPRILTRGKELMERIRSILASYGYATVTPDNYVHDCGEMGWLAQSRRRMLLIGRHADKVPPYLHEPPKRPLRAVGEILGMMPLPGDPRGGAMHHVPRLQWKTWVRLAFVRAGGDWRTLNDLRVVDGKLADYLLMPEYRAGYCGVNSWDEACGTIAGRNTATNGAFSVADPRTGYPDSQHTNVLKVTNYEEAAVTVTGANHITGGALAVADPSHHGPAKFNTCYRVVRYDQMARAIQGGGGKEQCVADPRFANSQGEHSTKYLVQEYGKPSATITGSDRVGSGALCIADPRVDDRRACALGVRKWEQPTGAVAGESLPPNGTFAVADPRPGWENRYGNLAVNEWEQSSPTVIAGGKGVQGGWLSVADPRCSFQREKGNNYLTAGHYGVVPWDQSSGAVSAAASADNGRFSVADPRLPDPNEKCAPLIIAPDNTWHRPFTTLELAALQGFFDPATLLDPEGNLFDFEGLSDAAKREAIGNAVPPPAARAIAEVMGRTLLMAWAGESFALCAQPIWARPIATALSLDVREGAE